MQEKQEEEQCIHKCNTKHSGGVGTQGKDNEKDRELTSNTLWSKIINPPPEGVIPDPSNGSPL